MVTRTRTAAVAAACLVAASSACGSDEDQIRDTVNTFVNAMADGDGEEACEQLTKAAQARLVRITDHTPCPRAAEHLSRSKPGVDPGLAPVLLQVCNFDRTLFLGGTSRDTARVPCAGLAIPVVNGEGGWRINGLGWYLAVL